MKNSKKISITRRCFVKNTLKAATLLPLSGIPLHAFANNQWKSKLEFKQNNSKSLKILILGGTSFIGPHQIAYALKRGHQITIFTRGKTIPTIYKKEFELVEKLIGDRENNLDALKGRKWDVVIDNSGRKVEWTKATAQLLKDHVGLYVYVSSVSEDHVGLYVYVSSVSVYYPYYKANLKEGAPLVLKVPDNITDADEKYTYDYGVMKANSEIEARTIFGVDNTIVIRPTFMIGPADRTNRFLYWPRQLAKNGDVIIPGNKDDPVQFIDVRDVSDWMIRLIENKTAGTFNAVGPVSKMTIHEFAKGAHSAFDTKVNFITINDYKFLKDNSLLYLMPWILENKEYHGISRVSNELAIKNGLTYRPLVTSIKDTHDWWYSKAVNEERRAAFESDTKELHNRQIDILQKWKTYSNR
jgi:2'-hydroxyisoflavone reductase